MKKETLMKKFKAAEKLAKRLGFDDVYISEYGTFIAEDRATTVNIRAEIRYGSQYTIEIGWASAGTPRPSDAKVKRHIKMLQNALKVKAVLR